MIKTIKKLILIGVTSSLVSVLPLVGASAEWKQDNQGWWNSEGSSWSTGWKQIDSSWYYFGQDGYMLKNTIVDGYKLGESGNWIQNITNTTTTNTSTNVANTATANSNNMTNTTNNIDTSKNTTANTTLNNTGVINANTTNNVTVNNTSTKEATESEAQKELKAYNKRKLAESKDSLASAKSDLANLKSQKTIKTLKEVDGVWQYVGEVDQTKIDSAEEKVKTYQGLVDYYASLV